MTPSDSTRTNWNLTLAGSFTLSAWVKTTATKAMTLTTPISARRIFWAYNDHNDTNDTIPLAITGSKAAFTTRGTAPAPSPPCTPEPASTMAITT